MKTVILVLALLSIILPIGFYFVSERQKKDFKRSVLANIFTFFSVLIIGGVVLFSGAARAEGVIAASDSLKGIAFIAAAAVTGLACIGAGIAVAAASSSALGALSEDEKVFGKALIFVALAEGIALYGLLVSFTILGQVM